MEDEKGVVAEVTEGFCQKAEVAVPEKLFRADGEVGVKKDFHKHQSQKSINGRLKRTPCKNVKVCWFVKRRKKSSAKKV